jgi:hypothetical protein
MESESQQQNNNNWRIQDIWNELLTEDRPITPRSYIRASEIGKPYLDRYLAMKGVQPTNPFSPRIKRVFDCGLIFEVDVVERMFKLLGILQSAQTEVKYKRDGLLEVIGHYDHKVGGQINVSQVQESLADPLVSPWMKKRTEKLLEKLMYRYPQGMRTLIAEIKTVNSRSFWSHKNQDPETGFFKGYDHHKLQLYTYLMALQEDEGRVFYISKDDLTLFETSIYLSDQKLADLWEEDIAIMTYYYLANKEPDREPDIIFNEDKGMYEANWKIGRSNYLKLITGFETTDEWESSLYGQLKDKNKGKCIVCEKSFQLVTLNKNGGLCGRCAKGKPKNSFSGIMPAIL